MNTEDFKQSGYSNICYTCCIKNAKHICGQCMQVYYCSENCQRSDWFEHKSLCKKKLRIDPIFVKSIITSYADEINLIEKQRRAIKLKGTIHIIVNDINERIVKIEPFRIE
jgi:hypothetical protein